MRKVKSIQERMAQIRAAQQSGAYPLCPRCGEATMKPELHTNALSRQYDIMICDLCGMDEAKMAFMGAPMPLAHWACLDVPTRHDFKAVPRAQALRRIEDEQLPWRLDAYERCPGLTTLWFEPFVARYAVAEGTLVISFRQRNGTAQYAADLIAD